MNTVQKFTDYLRSRPIVGALCAVALGALYGLLLRLVMEQELMSVSFIFLVPIALGFVTVWYSPEKWRMKWWYAAVMPWLAAFLFLAGAMLANLEGLICVVFFFLLLGLWAVWAGCARESLREPMPKQMPKHLRPAKP